MVIEVDVDVVVDMVVEIMFGGAIIILLVMLRPVVAEAGGSGVAEKNGLPALHRCESFLFLLLDQLTAPLAGVAVAEVAVVSVLSA